MSGSYEVGEHPTAKTLNVPMSCMQCEDAACVTVCPTGASYKRSDGIVLVDPDKCMGCNYCDWACPYGARELDQNAGTMKNARCARTGSTTSACPKPSGNPACVLACPTQARMSGDCDDPVSAVSVKVRERDGFGM